MAIKVLPQSLASEPERVARFEKEARLDAVFIMIHNEYMGKDAAITIRIPASLKRSLEARAKAQHRSVSAQVVADLEKALTETSDEVGGKGRFLGLFEGTRLPTDEEIQEVRDLLWGSESRPGRHG